MVKRCCRCKSHKTVSEFSKCSIQKDGLRRSCKECRRKEDSIYRQSKRAKMLVAARARKFRATEKGQKYRKAYKKSEAGRKSDNEYKRRLYETPEGHQKIRARLKAFYNIRTGKLIRKPCEVCGTEKVQAHHEDYSKPLDVKWLCYQHHHEHHMKEAG